MEKGVRVSCRNRQQLLDIVSQKEQEQEQEMLLPCDCNLCAAVVASVSVAVAVLQLLVPLVSGFLIFRHLLI